MPKLRVRFLPGLHLVAAPTLADTSGCLSRLYAASAVHTDLQKQYKMMVRDGKTFTTSPLLAERARVAIDAAARGV